MQLERSWNNLDYVLTECVKVASVCDPGSLFLIQTSAPKGH